MYLLPENILASLLNVKKYKQQEQMTDSCHRTSVPLYVSTQNTNRMKADASSPSQTRLPTGTRSAGHFVYKALCIGKMIKMDGSPLGGLVMTSGRFSGDHIKINYSFN